MTPPKLLRGLSTYLPSPAARLQPAKPKPPPDSPFKSQQTASPRVLGACSLPWIPAANGQVGASRRVRDGTRGSSRATTAGAPTQAAEGRRVKAPDCAILGTGSPCPHRAPCALHGPLTVHLPAGMESFHAITPTQWLSPPRRAATETRRACQSPFPRVPRRSRAGVAAPQASGAATRARSCPGPPRLQREPQGRRRALRGRDGLQTPSLGGAARGASTLGPDAAKVLLGRSTDQG